MNKRKISEENEKNNELWGKGGKKVNYWLKKKVKKKIIVLRKMKLRKPFCGNKMQFLRHLFWKELSEIRKNRD